MPLSPNAKKIQIRKRKGARNQKKGTKKEVCSDGACAVKPKANNPIVRVSPNRKRGIRTHKPAIAYPGMEIKRRSSSINRSLQKRKDESLARKLENGFDPFPQYTRRVSSEARKRGIRTHKNAIGYPGMKIKRRNSSINRSIQKRKDESLARKLENGFDPFPQYPRRDSSIARSLQQKMDESLAKSLQRKHDLSYALALDRIINNRGHLTNQTFARLLQGNY